MKRIIKPKRVGVLIFSFLFVMACVTINIYFPAEKVESVAGEIVNDIRGKHPGKEESPPSKKQDSCFRKTLLAFSPSLVWADEVTTVSNPTIRALKTRMKARFEEMKPFYQKRMLVEGDDGYVSLGNTGGLNLKDLRNLKTLVSAENSDRSALYNEVAQALKIDSSQVNRVGGIFAKEWQKSVP